MKLEFQAREKGMREMRLVCPLFSAQIAFFGKQASVDFPSSPSFLCFLHIAQEKKKKELEALKLLPPPAPRFFFYGRNSSLKKGGGGLRLQENKEPYHHGVWILAQTWGLGGRA